MLILIVITLCLQDHTQNSKHNRRDELVYDIFPVYESPHCISNECSTTLGCNAGLLSGVSKPNPSPEADKKVGKGAYCLKEAHRRGAMIFSCALVEGNKQWPKNRSRYHENNTHQLLREFRHLKKGNNCSQPGEGLHSSSRITGIQNNTYSFHATTENLI